MRRIVIALIALALPASALADPVRVRGYIRSDGTYVPPHVRSSPNGSTLDNWSTKPNYNPYTGQQGTQNPAPPVPQWRPYNSVPVQPRTPPAARCAAGSIFC